MLQRESEEDTLPTIKVFTLEHGFPNTKKYRLEKFELFLGFHL